MSDRTGHSSKDARNVACGNERPLLSVTRRDTDKTGFDDMAGICTQQQDLELRHWWSIVGL